MFGCATDLDNKLDNIIRKMAVGNFNFKFRAKFEIVLI